METEIFSFPFLKKLGQAKKKDENTKAPILLKSDSD